MEIVKNTWMLYVLILSSYFFAFISIPYQTRVLGPELFGIVGLATATMIFVQLIIDFGFMLSATAEISKNRKSPKKTSNILSNVFYAKIALSFIALIIFLFFSIFIDSFLVHWELFVLFFLASVAASFLPDYVYRGMEKMSPITIRTILVRLFFTIMIFVLLKKPSDYLIIPTLLLIGNIVAVLLVYVDIKKRFKIHITKPRLVSIYDTMKKSSHYFVSRVASAIYGAGNTIILNAYSPGINVGYYVAADRLMNTSKSVMSPIADSVYPYMIKNKNFNLIKKVLMITMPTIIGVTALAYIIAPTICVFLFGKEYESVAPLLRILLPIAIFTLPSYLLGFPTLGAMGLSKHANNSVIYAAVLQLCLMLILIMTNNINIYSVALSATISEGFVLIYRIYIVYVNRRII